MAPNGKARVFLHHAIISPLESLPAELFNMIIQQLPSVRDVARLSQTCKTLQSRFTDKGKVLWCQYFTSVFDRKTIGSTDKAFTLQKGMYRRIVQGRTFGDSGRRGLWTDKKTFTALKRLVRDAYSHGADVSANMKTMVIAAVKLKLFDRLFFPSKHIITNYDKTWYLSPILLTMLHVGFDAWNPELNTMICSFPESKTAAYEHLHIYPLFMKTPSAPSAMSRNMMPHSNNLLLIANFFRAYLLARNYGSDVWKMFYNLPPNLRPQAWTHQLDTNSSELVGTTYWKGCQAFMPSDNIGLWREKGARIDDNRFILDHDDFDEDKLAECEFFDLRLNFLGKGDGELFWPDELESEAPICVEGYKRSRAADSGVWLSTNEDNTPMVGFLRGREYQRVVGNMHPLLQTSGINGFRRISFVTSPTAATGWVEKTKDVLKEVNNGAFMELVYEGVIMPGGNVIVGRWWSSQSEPLSWAVPLTSGHPSQPEVPATLEQMSTWSAWDDWKQESKNSYFDTGPFMFWRVKKTPVAAAHSDETRSDDN